MVQIPKTVMLDLTHDTILSQVKELQAQRGLNNCEMELILTQVINDIKTAKEKDYAETIFDLVYELQQKEQQSKESVMEPINNSDVKMQDMQVTFDKMEFTPDKIEVNQEQE